MHTEEQVKQLWCPMAGEPRILTEPLRRKKPAAYFVNSMGDLFHENVSDAWIDQVFAVMALCPQHTFQVLTKRAERLREYTCEIISEPIRYGKWASNGCEVAESAGKGRCVPPKWPLPNVWLGVSAEDQARAEERVPHLLRTPAAVRFVSCEPLLGPVELDAIVYERDATSENYLDALFAEGDVEDDPIFKGSTLDWVIVGGESGHSARPMHPDWARSLRDQCKAAGVPFFMKQMDKNLPIPDDLMIREWPEAQS